MPKKLIISFVLLIVLIGIVVTASCTKKAACLRLSPDVTVVIEGHCIIYEAAELRS